MVCFPSDKITLYSYRYFENTLVYQKKLKFQQSCFQAQNVQFTRTYALRNIYFCGTEGIAINRKNNTTKLSRLTQYLLNSDIASDDCLVQPLLCFDASINLAFLVAGGTLESLNKDDNGNRKSQIKITLLVIVAFSRLF